MDFFDVSSDGAGPSTDPVAAALERLVVQAAHRADELRIPTVAVWEVVFQDRPDDGAGTSSAAFWWRARPAECPATASSPLEAVVGFSAEPDVFGLVMSWTAPVDVAEARITLGLLRDGTLAMLGSGLGLPTFLDTDTDVPAPPVQVLRRALSLPSGLPEPVPSLLVARLQVAVFDAVLRVPPERLPVCEQLSVLVQSIDVGTAAELERLVESWAGSGLPEPLCRRGLLLSALAEHPTAAAGLMSGSLTAALIPLVGDPQAWPLVLARLRATPPVDLLPSEFWGWADDAMIADLLSQQLPPLGQSELMSAAVRDGSLPAEVADRCASSVVSLAAG